MRGFVVPRGITVLAGGVAEADSGAFTLVAEQGGVQYTIGENLYLAKNASSGCRSGVSPAEVILT